MRRLNDTDLEKVIGGYIFHATNISGADQDKLWEVINEDGEVIGRYATHDDAIYYAGWNQESKREINWDELCKLRRGEQI